MFKKITRKNLEKFLERYASKEKVLDIGSGGSSYGRFFPNRLTVDIDPDRKPEIVADAHNLPFKDNEFALVLCTEVIEHVKDPRKVVHEIKRVLKPGGRVILTTRFVYQIHDAPHDYWRFTKYGMQELFSDWNIIELIPETENFSTLGVLIQRIAFQSRLRANRLSKFILLLLASLSTKLNWLIKEEYGDIKKSHKESGILASGYYIVAEKQ